MRGPATREVPAGLAYDEVYTAGRPVRGWSISGIVTAVVLFLVAVPTGVILLFVVFYAITDVHHLTERTTALGDLTSVTPAEFLYINLTLVLTIPFMGLCTLLFHQLRPTWLLSVSGRIRWRWLLVSVGVAVVSLAVAIALDAVLPTGEGTATTSGASTGLTQSTLEFLLIVLLLTPLQSAAEEFAFRGYLTQAFGAIFRRRWVSVLAPALLFACAHFPQPPTAFVDRFSFGVVSGILVIATGGLEAGIAYHVVNNLIAFGSALAFSSMTEAFNPPEGGWGDVLVSLVKSLVFVGLSIAVARRMGVATRTGGSQLVRPRAPV